MLEVKCATVINSTILVILNYANSRIFLTYHAVSGFRRTGISFMTMFQQHSVPSVAPSHRAMDTIELLQQVTPDFIGADLWPSNSPDLNPVWIIRSWVLRSSECMNIV